MYDLSKYKFIISSGCSYGMIPRNLNHMRKTNIFEIDDDCVVVDLQQDSQSANYSADSIIHTIEVLKSKSVPVENIYVINEWTGWERTQMVFPSSTMFQIFENNDLHPQKVASLNKDSSLLDYLNDLLGFKTLRSKKFKGMHCPIVFIDNLSYVNASHLDIEEFSDTNYYFWIKLYQETHAKIQNETLINDWFNHVLKLQYYLKLNNIEYNFHFMSSVFSNYFKDEHKNLYQAYQSKYQWDDSTNRLVNREQDSERFYSNLTEKNDLIYQFPEIQFKFNQLDLSRFWFADSDKYRYGGVDEYVMENFPYFGYSSLHMENDNMRFHIENFNNHPELVLYSFVAKEVLKECKFIKFNEDVITKLRNEIFYEVNTGNDKTNKYFLTLRSLKGKFHRYI